MDRFLHGNNSPIAHALRGTLTRSDHRRFIEDINIQSRPAALIKPGRRLGGAWIDNFVADRKSVSICFECDRKYKGWHEKHNYEARSKLELTDCDGCGQQLQVCRGYYYKVLQPS